MSLRKLLPLIACALATGCASAVGTFYKPRPYMGTRFDAWVLASAFSSSTCSYGSRILAPFALIDLPLSLALDTALLPVTVPAALLYTPPAEPRCTECSSSRRKPSW